MHSKLGSKPTQVLNETDLRWDLIVIFDTLQQNLDNIANENNKK